MNPEKLDISSHCHWSYCHRGGADPLLGDTIDRRFTAIARSRNDGDALVSMPQKRRLSYAELLLEVRRLARSLVALGVSRGDRVGVWSTNNVEWVLLQLATARVGALLVTINPAYRISELEHALDRARVQTLFLMPAFRRSHYVAMVRELCPELSGVSAEEFSSPRLPSLRRLVVFDPDDPDRTVRPDRGFITWPEFIEGAERTREEEVERRERALDPDDPVNIQFTSGTTGFPKAVVLTHHNILNNGWFTARAMHLGPEDRVCVPVPFYHCFGMVVSNLACFSCGATVVIPAEHFDAGETLRAIERERCTALHGVPTMFIAELEHAGFADFDLSSLRTGIVAGAPCPPELMRRVQDEMGCREILIGYGQTEASPITHLTRPEDSLRRRVETVGTNLPHQEVKVVDTDSGAIVALEEAGEVCFRGYHVMRGYYGQPEATREAIDEAGWLHSGDLGALDAAGYLRITGRLKDMIIRGGENIYPAEIEAFYYEHPKVAEVAVFGVPDEKVGEEVGAWIKLHEGEEASAAELREFARGRIAHFKVPRYIWIVDKFPMTVTGKIQKFRIREIVATEMGQSAPAESG